MSHDQPYFFVSYSRRDVEIVHKVVGELEKRGIRIWVDTKGLQPGMNWVQEISHALESAAGLIIFLSSASMASDFVNSELRAALQYSGKIFPILLEYIDLPYDIARYQYLDLRVHSEESIISVADTLAKVLKSHLLTPSEAGAGLKRNEITQVARETAEDVQGTPPITVPSAPPDSIFIVHGRDILFRDDVENYLISINIAPIVLAKMPNAGQMSIFTKFLQYGHLAHFAVVLFSSDDYGVLCDDYDDTQSGGKQTLQYRSRQNVILELGFFYGKLGFDKVFGLIKDPPRRFPRFDMPSDVQGIPYETYDAAGLWKNILRLKLRSHGFAV